MEFYSHARKNDDGSVSPTKKIRQHLEGVVENMALNLHPYVNFNNLRLPPDLPELLGLFHDMGKHTTYFQDYLLRGKFKNELKKNHSLLSAVFAFNFADKWTDRGGSLLPFIVFFCIKHHHGSLPNPRKLSDMSRQLSEQRNLKIQSENLLKHAKLEIEGLVKDHFRDSDTFLLTEHFLEYREKKLRKTANRLQRKSAKADHYFLTLYLFSLLISSDKIDAGEANLFSPSPISPNLVDDYLARKKDRHLADIRTRAKDNIESRLSEIDVSRDRLFTITAPTGIGKTLSVMNFALKLKEKISSVQKYQPQIIYCLPFINIIEQTYKVFCELFRKEGISLLKHHQYTDIWGMAEKESVGDDEVQLSKKLLEIEDWQADVVLTTFVQFFHSVISNRNRMLKKFHRIAGSIIILDEVQNIKAEYWPLIGTVLYHLSEFLNCRMILMTATQPLIFETANRVFEHNQQKQIEFRPLLNSEETGFYFEQFERTKLVSLIDKENPLENADDFYALFCEKWDPSKSCLIVVNTIKRSLDIFERLSEEETISDIYYLSTNIVPVHRKYVIRKIKRLLDEDRKVILVSTQSVEAGVDLDFDMGFRDVGPLDSVIQVAGRINRNNREGFRHSPLYIVNFEGDAQRIYGRITINTSLEIFDSEKEFFSENEYLQLIGKYYDLITNEDRKSFEEARELYEAVEKLRFTRDSDDEELAVEDFRLIDDARGNYADVFIPLTKYAANTLDIYENVYLQCNEMLERRRIYLKIKSAFNQYKLSLPLSVIQQLYNNSNGVRELTEKRLYVVERGYIGKSDEDQMFLYDYETGFFRKEIESETLIF
ncbi:CRISPR-associated helicase Cas3' [Desulfobacterales bacterium HSG2]|nr:CRISPR-associated helicase Cas3' [Desulfobacterales bacterium HSG2]